jgi:hypothetical protein
VERREAGRFRKTGARFAQREHVTNAPCGAPLPHLREQIEMQNETRAGLSRRETEDACHLRTWLFDNSDLQGNEMAGVTPAITSCFDQQNLTIITTA